jgi:hypothetical protein
MRLSLFLLLLPLIVLSLALPTPPLWRPFEPTASTLRGAPGVAQVEVLVSPPRSAHRIIHVADWHMVPRDLFALDVQQAADRALTEEQVAQAYTRHLADVEACQAGQMAFLRWLAREDAMVRAALAVRPVVVIVLGGAHDLSGSVRRLAPGSEYVRVRVKGYPEKAGQSG